MKVVVATVAGVVALPVLVIGAALGGVAVEEVALGGVGGIPTALADVPADMAALYEEAARRFGVPVAVLTAVGKVECDHNRNPACGQPNAAGARGPMQFIPQTWAAYAWASDNTDPSPYDPRDAVFAAAAKLAADGVADDPWRALYGYNPADRYVATVVAWALACGWELEDPTLLARAVLAHPHLELRPAAATDVAEGHIDGRLLAVLLIGATTHRIGAVGPFISGHAYFVAGTNRPSHHAFGRAVDIGAVDGAAVGVGNAAARAFAELLLSLPPPLSPGELGVPWADLADHPNTFSDASHARHIHVAHGPPT